VEIEEAVETRNEVDAGTRDWIEKQEQHGDENQNPRSMAEKQTMETPNQNMRPMAEKQGQHENEDQNSRQMAEKQAQETPLPTSNARPSMARRAAKSAKTPNTPSPNLANIGVQNNKCAPARPLSAGAAAENTKSKTAAVPDPAATSAPGRADAPDSQGSAATVPSSPQPALRPLSFNAYKKPVQDKLSVSEYFRACCAHARSVGVGEKRLEAQREFIVDFIKGLRETAERKRVVEGLEAKGLATFERETRRVEFFCGWGGVVEVVKGFEMASGRL